MVRCWPCYTRVGWNFSLCEWNPKMSPFIYESSSAVVRYGIACMIFNDLKNSIWDLVSHMDCFELSYIEFPDYFQILFFCMTLVTRFRSQRLTHLQTLAIKVWFTAWNIETSKLFIHTSWSYFRSVIKMKGSILFSLGLMMLFLALCCDAGTVTF